MHRLTYRSPRRWARCLPQSAPHRGSGRAPAITLLLRRISGESGWFSWLRGAPRRSQDHRLWAVLPAPGRPAPRLPACHLTAHRRCVASCKDPDLYWYLDLPLQFISLSKSCDGKRWRWRWASHLRSEYWSCGSAAVGVALVGAVGVVELCSLARTFCRVCAPLAPNGDPLGAGGAAGGGDSQRRRRGGCDLCSRFAPRARGRAGVAGPTVGRGSRGPRDDRLLPQGGGRRRQRAGRAHASRRGSLRRPDAARVAQLCRLDSADVGRVARQGACVLP